MHSKFALGHETMIKLITVSTDHARLFDRARLRALAIDAATLAFVLLLWVPWQPQMRLDDLDGAWQFALNHAFVHHWDFTQRVIWTSGPWGVVYGGFHPQTVWWQILTWAFFAVAFWKGVRALGASALWTITLATLAILSFEPAPDVRMLILITLLPMVHFFATG